MKTGLISDIHGNYEALCAVLSELDRLRVDRVYCLGDVVGYYSQVNECCDELRKREIPCLMGNHDWYMVSGGVCLRSKSVNDCLAYQRKVITDENLKWLDSFPVQRRVDNIQMVHAGWADPIDEYFEPREEYFSLIPGQLFVSGHTHIQSLNVWPTRTHCNPGSVGQPRDGDPRAAFAVLENDIFTLYRTPYNLEKVFKLMDMAGFSDYYYGGLKTGSKNLRKL